MLPNLHTGTLLCLNTPCPCLPRSSSTFRMWSNHHLFHHASPASQLVSFQLETVSWFFWPATRLVVPKSPEADPGFVSFSVGPGPAPHRPCAGCYGKVTVHRLDHSLRPQDLTCRGKRWQKPETHAGRWVRRCEGKKMVLSRDRLKCGGGGHRKSDTQLKDPRGNMLKKAPRCLPHTRSQGLRHTLRLSRREIACC